MTEAFILLNYSIKMMTTPNTNLRIQFEQFPHQPGVVLANRLIRRVLRS